MERVHRTMVNQQFYFIEEDSISSTYRPQSRSLQYRAQVENPLIMVNLRSLLSAFWLSITRIVVTGGRGCGCGCGCGCGRGCGRGHGGGRGREYGHGRDCGPAISTTLLVGVADANEGWILFVLGVSAWLVDDVKSKFAVCDIIINHGKLSTTRVRNVSAGEVCFINERSLRIHTPCNCDLQYPGRPL